MLQDHLLTEVGPLGQLLLDFFMVGEVFLQVRYHGLHLMVPEHDVLCALALVVQLGCQLHVLQNGKSRGALQLLFVCHRVLHANSPDLHQHIFTEPVNLLQSLFFDAFKHLLLVALLELDLLLPHLQLGVDLIVVLLELEQVSLLISQCCNLVASPLK